MHCQSGRVIASLVALLAGLAGASPPAEGASNFDGAWVVAEEQSPSPYDFAGTIRVSSTSSSEALGLMRQADESYNDEVVYICDGGRPGQEPPKVSGWFVMTYQWSGGGRMGGCRSDRTSYSGGIDFWSSSAHAITGLFRDTEGEIYFGGSWGTPSGGDFGFVAYPNECAPAGASAPARPSAINEVRIVSCVEGCEYRTSDGADWRPIAPDRILKAKHEVSCDPDGSVTLAFADNSTVTVRNTTQLKIGSFFTEGGVVRTELILKMGEISAKVNKSETTRSDFKIKTPTAVSSVRGTEFSVFYDPGGRASLTSVKDGTVEVNPVKAGLRNKTIGAGKEVEVTAKRVSAVAGVGKAGARGGLTRAEALEKVMKRVAKANKPCGITTPRTGAFGTKPARGGWLVSVKVIGRSKGTAKWNVTARKAAPANRLARKLATSCR